MCDERLWLPLWQELQVSAQPPLEFIHLEIPQLNTVDKIVAHLAKQITNDESFLVGFSLGGYLASELTLKYPKKIKQLLLVSNMSSALADNELKERTRTIDWIKSNGYSGIASKRVQGLLHRNAHTNKSIISTIQTMDKDLGKDILLHQLTVTTQRENLLPKLVKASIPITFCIGEQDGIADLKKVTKSTKSNQNISVQAFTNSGHMLPLEQPVLLAKTILNWLNE
jgi:pimeloyl-ACP methyl ester carboxylesterase